MNHRKKRKLPLPIYLDEFERQKLETIAESWGVNLSNTVKRLIREKLIK
ncbi:ribbon-helix-helix protein, CopG family [Komarekiella sp. 'clone 1']|uniref:Ribbon-helix-helix protein, CopG family n=1 Tax=Komarekiella delphini-convector SJRDD-AB1 TaxID=2593771 RepID=A0AA40T465_9NOST|nr:ribbon-helix-helix protein, CopG family [Komarekiella delphini-convector SJRDD-AB1]